MIGWAERLKEWPMVDQSYNVAPTTLIAAFRGDIGEAMRWGMIPSWSKSFDSKYATFNARIETVDTKPTFRNAWNNLQRCLIPMAGYYEWVGEKGDKQPVYITDPNTGGIVTAGLWEKWGDESLSCTILTKSADEELLPIHPRMPVMLTPEQGEAWLTGEYELDQPERPNVIYFPVSKVVGNTRNDSDDLIKPIDC